MFFKRFSSQSFHIKSFKPINEYFLLLVTSFCLSLNKSDRIVWLVIKSPFVLIIFKAWIKTWRNDRSFMSRFFKAEPYVRPGGLHVFIGCRGSGRINDPGNFIISYRGNYMKKMIAGTPSMIHGLGQRPSNGQEGGQVHMYVNTRTHAHTHTWSHRCGPSVHLTD